jgi:hypothetical protein
MPRSGVRVLLLLLAAGACGGDTNPSMSSGDVVDDADEAAVTILRRCVGEFPVCVAPPELLRHTQGFVTVGTSRALTPCADDGGGGR